MVLTNNALPEKYRVSLRYAHLPTMLTADPSEAVHSELQTETLVRYFELLEYKRLGGGIAYQLLYMNTRLHADQRTPEGQRAIQFVLEEDRKALLRNPDFNLFTFFVAKPKRPESIDPVQLLTWQAEEDEREANAGLNGGRYYPQSALEIIYGGFTAAEHIAG
jgi:hypothetical protein